MEKAGLAVLVLSSTGLIFSLLLAFLNKKLKVKKDPLLEKILEILPGINCGACGFRGCGGFAEAVIRERRLFSGCRPAGEAVNRQIAKILNIAADLSGEKPVAICHCQAEAGEKKVSANYQGPQTCQAAALIGGGIDCAYGCIGFGDCIPECPTGALNLNNHSIRINIQECIGCGKCVEACPRNLFEIIPRTASSIFFIGCNNPENALNVRTVCSRGCIGCGICTRIENSPYCLKGNLACINYQNTEEQTAALKAGQEKCPTQCIRSGY